MKTNNSFLSVIALLISAVVGIAAIVYCMQYVKTYTHKDPLGDMEVVLYELETHQSIHK